MMSDVDKSIWNDQLFEVAKPSQTRESPTEETLRLAPQSPAAAGTDFITCMRCQTPNEPDTDFCTACGEPVAAVPPSRESAGSVPVALAVSVGLTLAGVATWAVLAHLIGWLWLHFLAVGVAALAGYGLTLYTDRRGPEMGLLAMAIGLVGIIVAKLVIANWVIMPKIDSFLQSESPFVQTEVTDEWVGRALADPQSTFTYVCYHLAEEYEWDEDFTHKVTMYHAFKKVSRRNRLPFRWSRAEVEQLNQAVREVEE
jgi:hypothetical protein